MGNFQILEYDEMEKKDDEERTKIKPYQLKERGGDVIASSIHGINNDNDNNYDENNNGWIFDDDHLLLQGEVTGLTLLGGERDKKNVELKEKKKRMRNNYKKKKEKEVKKKISSLVKIPSTNCPIIQRSSDIMTDKHVGSVGQAALRNLLAKANYDGHSKDISDNNDCYDNYDNEQDEEEPVEKKKAVINYQDEIQLQKVTSCNHNHVTSLDSAGPAFNHTSRTVNHHKKLRDKSNRKINNHPIRRHTKRTKVGNNKRTDFVPDKVESGFEILKKLLSTTTNARHGDTKNNKKKKRKQQQNEHDNYENEEE